MRPRTDVTTRFPTQLLVSRFKQTMEEEGGPRDVTLSSVTWGTDWNADSSTQATGDCPTRHGTAVPSSTCPAAHIQEQRMVLWVDF